MTPLERLDARLTPLGASQINMFGGICFMLKGNMIAGTNKDRILFRVGPTGDGEAEARNEGEQMVMRGKPMSGYWFVPAAVASQPDRFEWWIEKALEFNGSLPAKGKRIR
jgi:TfoX/Sxy family transcriptional regulator of competence genes